MTHSRFSDRHFGIRVAVLVTLTFGLYLACVALARSAPAHPGDPGTIRLAAAEPSGLDKGRPSQRVPERFGCRRSAEGCTGARNS